MDEEACQNRAQEMAIGESSSIPVTSERSITGCADIDVCTAEGDPSTDVTGSEKLDPHLLRDYCRYASQVSFTYHPVLIFFYALEKMT